jgi:hypothetical protein
MYDCVALRPQLHKTQLQKRGSKYAHFLIKPRSAELVKYTPKGFHGGTRGPIHSFVNSHTCQNGPSCDSVHPELRYGGEG